MKTLNEPEVELSGQGQDEAVARFSQALGIPNVNADPEIVGGKEFLKFRVGRNAPIYDQALRDTNKSLPDQQSVSGAARPSYRAEPGDRFPRLVRSRSSKRDFGTVNSCDRW